ncbi:MAG: hypothetical protein V3T86_12875 [Planctomycetota bacterium]
MPNRKLVSLAATRPIGTRVIAAFVIAAGVLTASVASAQDNGITYTPEQIAETLANFKSSAKDKKQPEDDAIALLEELKDAYFYIAKKGDEATKDEAKAQKSIVKTVGWGLKRRKRDQVNLECAKALGAMGHKDGNKDLVKWMDNKVLDSKTPNTEWVEFGFMALANIGQEDQALELTFNYARGKHTDYSVCDKALAALAQWRTLNPKNRKEIFNKVLQLMQSLDSGRRSGGNQQRVYQDRYDRVKDNAMRTLQELAGEGKGFGNVTKATDWWKANKGRKWEPYIGVAFRKAPAKSEKKDEEKAGEKKDEES